MTGAIDFFCKAFLKKITSPILLSLQKTMAQEAGMTVTSTTIAGIK
jgi:hypothetical protein